MPGFKGPTIELRLRPRRMRKYITRLRKPQRVNKRGKNVVWKVGGKWVQQPTTPTEDGRAVWCMPIGKRWPIKPAGKTHRTKALNMIWLHQRLTTGGQQLPFALLSWPKGFIEKSQGSFLYYVRVQCFNFWGFSPLSCGLDNALNL